MARGLAATEGHMRRALCLAAAALGVAAVLAPGTGTPEPGGMTSGDLLWACRRVAESLELVGAEVVEVIPTAVGSADMTALVADRIVREILTGIARRRVAGHDPLG